MSNNLFIKVLYLSTSLGLSACSVLPDFMSMETGEITSPTDRAEANGETDSSQSASIMSQQDAAVGRYIHEWQSMKPSIERLVAMEGELKELIIQLNQLSKTPNAELTAHELVADQPSKPKDKGGSQAALQKTGAAIQLASVRDKAVMTSTWSQLLKRYPSIFDTLTPIYEEAMVGGQKYYRLKASGIVSKVAAIRLCEELDAQLVPCFLVSNTGNLLF